MRIKKYKYIIVQLKIFYCLRISCIHIAYIDRKNAHSGFTHGWSWQPTWVCLWHFQKQFNLIKSTQWLNAKVGSYLSDVIGKWWKEGSVSLIRGNRSLEGVSEVFFCLGSFLWYLFSIPDANDRKLCHHTLRTITYWTWIHKQNKPSWVTLSGILMRATQSWLRRSIIVKMSIIHSSITMERNKLWHLHVITSGKQYKDGLLKHCRAN